MYLYHLRLVLEVFPQELLEYLTIDKGTQRNKYIYVKEKGKQTEKEHFHIIFESDKKIDAIRKNLQRRYQSKGNGFYSLKVCMDTMYKYLAKEADFYESNWVTPEYFNELKKQSREYVSELVQRRQNSILTYLKEWIKDKQRKTKQDIAGELYDHVVRNKLDLPMMCIMRKYVDQIYYLQHVSYREDFINQFYNH